METEVTGVRSTQGPGSFWGSSGTISSLEEEAKVSRGESPPHSQIPTREALPGP